MDDAELIVLRMRDTLKQVVRTATFSHSGPSLKLQNRRNSYLAINLPLPTTLSQLLIAFTIEHDNEWEIRYWINANPAPLRTSLVMWANFVRFLDKGGITVEEISRKAGYPPSKVHPDLAGMIRWRYVTVDSKNPKKPKLTDTIQPTIRATEATQAWIPLVAEIEERWVERFGAAHVNRLKQALIPIIAAFDRPLLHYFPVLNHRNGMWTLDPHEPECDPPQKLALPYLLSQVHHLFTLEAERNSDISLAIRSNVLRVVDLKLIDKKALPQPSGISKEALSMSINWLIKKGYMVEEPLPLGRGKAVRLTGQGKAEKGRYSEIIDGVAQTWRAMGLADQLDELRSALVPFVAHGSGPESQLFQGLTATPGLWRAEIPKRAVLPHHPMVLYRGGWPDGS